MTRRWTFLLLKPDAVRRRLAPTLLRRLHQHALSVRRRLPLRLTTALVDDALGPFTFAALPSAHTETLRERYRQYLTSGPCEYWEIVAPPGVDERTLLLRLRSLRGESFFPERCSPGSIRFDFRDDRCRTSVRAVTHVEGFGDVADDLVENLVHTPGTKEERDHQAAAMLRALAR